MNGTANVSSRLNGEPIDTDLGIAVLTGLGALALMILGAGSVLMSADGGVALVGAAAVSPIPGDTAIAASLAAQKYASTPPATHSPKAYAVKAGVGL